jgi:myo-inositol-1-phosphate synthase
MAQIKVALVGVGNCASALVQGVQFYGKTNDFNRLAKPSLGKHGTKRHINRRGI